MSGDFLCGSLAGAAADTCLFPLDVLRARAMVRPGVRGVLAEAALLLNREGVRAFYKGLPVHLLANIPSNGIFYATYEAVKAGLAPHLASAAVTHAVSAAAANAPASHIALLATSPDFLGPAEAAAAAAASSAAFLAAFRPALVLGRAFFAFGHLSA